MRRHHRVVLSCLVFATLFGSGSARGDTINFDVDAGGAPIVAPPAFSSTSPLTTLYSPLGVTFSGPSAGSGGAILNGSSNFGVAPRSGNNFLAFNRNGYATDPESIAFANLVGLVSIWASGGSSGNSFRIDAFDAGDTLVATGTATSNAGAYSELSVAFAGGISRVVLTGTGGDNAFVFDDLSFTPLAIPEPGPLGLAGVGGLSMIGFRLARARRRAR